MKAVTVELSDDLASRIQSLSEFERKELNRIIALWLGIKKPRHILEVMDEIAKYAKDQGMTPEVLEALLKDES